MNIVFMMTRAADCFEYRLPARRLAMTRVAIEADMGARQREFRLRIVVKSPEQPAFGVMAGDAVDPQPTLMETVLMALLAEHRRGLEVAALVAVRARHRLVPSDQRKTGLVVVEIGG